MKTKETTTEKLARWHNTLNSWEWPEDYPKNKPDDWDDLPFYDGTNRFRDRYKIIDQENMFIKGIIKYKEIMRWHWLHTLGRSNLHFEFWFWIRNNPKALRKYYKAIVWLEKHNLYSEFR